MTTQTTYQAQCPLCGLKADYLTEADASQALKAHRCPTGKRTAGVVSKVETVVDIGDEHTELSDLDKRWAAERQAHIEDVLAPEEAPSE